MHLLGIMVVALIIFNWIYVFVNTTTRIPCRRVSDRKLAVAILQSEHTSWKASTHSFLVLLAPFLQQTWQRHLHVNLITMVTKVNIVTRKAMTSSK